MKQWGRDVYAHMLTVQSFELISAQLGGSKIDDAMETARGKKQTARKYTIVVVSILYVYSYV